MNRSGTSLKTTIIVENYYHRAKQLYLGKIYRAKLLYTSFN